MLHHHEAWDGSGYPHGLKGDDTPLLARVAAVADAFDAMSSDRPYRRGMPDAKIDAIFREGLGRQWDPRSSTPSSPCAIEVRECGPRRGVRRHSARRRGVGTLSERPKAPPTCLSPPPWPASPTTAKTCCATHAPWSRVCSSRMTASYGEATVFAGFRGEALSLYFDDDPAFHFNALGQLRRAYAAERLIKADRGPADRHAARVRTAADVQLQSEPLADGAQQSLLADVATRLAALRAALDAGQCRVDGQEPADGDAVARLAAWLASNPRPAAAASPRVM